MLDSSTLPFVIYRSSAGSGKTYTLAREYLKLALRDPKDNPNPFKRILAVTFTNKAMQEMKDRIIRYLNEFSQGNHNEMSAEIMATLQLDKQSFEERCSNVLSKILHGYGHFAVTTIDAFFQQVVRSFAKELQVGGNYHLELDQNLIYKKVVDCLMADLGNHPETERWITEFSFSKLDEGSGWEIDSRLVKFLKDLDSEIFRAFDKKLWQINSDDVKQLIKEVNATVASYESRMKGFAQEAKQILESHGLRIGDLKNNINGYINYPLEGRFDKGRPNKDTLDAWENDVWYAQASKNKAQIDLAVNAGLREALDAMITLWEKESPSYNSAHLIRKVIYYFALSHALVDALDTYKRSQDMMFVSDATVLLKELVEGVDAPFIYEKVGGFFENFLIDEFQDTSVFQWQSFMPLIDNSLGSGHKNLIVGDVKQSIYRWRGGDLSLLHYKAQQEFQNRTTIENLKFNFRSAGRIVRFNNLLFQKLASHIDQSHPEIHLPFSDIYSDAAQELPEGRNPEEGYVELHMVPNKEYSKEFALEQTVEMLKHLQDCNVPLRETAILVRSNKDAKRVADHLMTYRAEYPSTDYSFDIVSSESLHLSSSPAVNCVVAALKFVERPTEKLYVATIIRFLHQLQTRTGNIGDLLVKDDPAVVKQLHSNAEYLQRLPLFSLVESLISLLGVDKYKGEVPYLLTFQDQVLSYAKSGQGDIRGLLEKWEEKIHKESIKISDDLDAIRILTIHKVKGLEFHSVLIPFLDWEFKQNTHSEWFTYSARDREYILQLGVSDKLKGTEFEEAYFTEMGQVYLDSLNMLYVAFTRASHDLWGISNVRGGRVSKWLNDVLSSLDFWSSAEGGIYQSGHRDFHYAGEVHTDEQVESLVHYPTTDWQSKLTLKPAPRRVKDENRAYSISAGIVIHDLLSSVAYASDLEKALAQGKFTSGIPEERYKHLETKIRLAFQNPEISAWYDASWEVKNECSIISEGQEYRPDRVMIRDKEVMVIDYKTGAEKSSDIKQMQRYVTLLSDMYAGSCVEGRILYLEDLKIVSV